MSCLGRIDRSADRCGPPLRRDPQSRLSQRGPFELVAVPADDDQLGDTKCRGADDDRPSSATPTLGQRSGLATAKSSMKPVGPPGSCRGEDRTVRAVTNPSSSPTGREATSVTTRGSAISSTRSRRWTAEASGASRHSCGWWHAYRSRRRSAMAARLPRSAGVASRMSAMSPTLEIRGPPPLDFHHYVAQAPAKIGGRISSMAIDQVRWVRIGPSTPPPARRWSPTTVPRMAAANTSTGLPPAKVASA